MSMGVARPAAKRGHGPIDIEGGLFQLGAEEGKRPSQNGFVFGGRLFEQSAKGNLIRFLAEEKTFKGIGNVRAGKLVERFGANLLSILRENNITVFDVLPQEVAVALFVNFEDAAASVELAMYLDSIGVDKWVGGNIVRSWGKLGAQRLIENPYLLISWVDWKKTDQVGNLVGIPKTDVKRLCAACEYVLYKRLSLGHTWTSIDNLQNGLSSLVGEDFAKKAIDVCAEDKGAIYCGDGLQPVGAAVMERYVVNQALPRDLVQQEMFDGLQLTDDQFTQALNEVEEQQGFKFTAMQISVIRSALEHNFSVIAGYVGSGKTSLLKAICSFAEASGLRIHLMALSGRAAKRITEATGYESSTISRFIRDFRGCELGGANLIWSMKPAWSIWPIYTGFSELALSLKYALLAIRRNYRQLALGHRLLIWLICPVLEKMSWIKCTAKIPLLEFQL